MGPVTDICSENRAVSRHLTRSVLLSPDERRTCIKYHTSQVDLEQKLTTTLAEFEIRQFIKRTGAQACGHLPVFTMRTLSVSQHQGISSPVIALLSSHPPDHIRDLDLLRFAQKNTTPTDVANVTHMFSMFAYSTKSSFPCLNNEALLVGLA